MNEKNALDLITIDEEEYSTAMTGDLGLALRAQQLLNLRQESETAEQRAASRRATASSNLTHSNSGDNNKPENRPNLFSAFFKAVNAG
ncbi:MAG: hypothetical protein PVG89_03250 [Gammaproteobacteria bacterium]|jgi:hypothetical protein